MLLRLTFGDGFRSGSQPPSWATVEWVGRAGHPSSYALLSGTRADRVRISVDPGDAFFKDALAANLDDVRWGLPREYEAAVLRVLSDQPTRVLVGRAAHALVGSSALSFAAVALLLSKILAVGVPDPEASVWAE